MVHGRCRDDARRTSESRRRVPGHNSRTRSRTNRVGAPLSASCASSGGTDYVRAVPFEPDDPTDERAQLVAILTNLGVAASEVPDDPGEAAAMASDVVLARGDSHSLRAIAEKVGQPLDQIADMFRHLGLQINDPDEILFNDADLEMVEFFDRSTRDLLTPSEAQEILHVTATSLATVAEAAIAGHVQGPEARTESMVEVALLNQIVAEAGLELSETLGTVFRHHLRRAAYVNRRTQSETHRELVTLAVGFLDLVGFTALSQELDVHELVELVKGFEAQAHERAHECRARIVKLIGDEVMIVAEHPADAARFSTELAASLDAAVLPRGGIAYGELINVHGDYFGPVVNLAARLTDAAVPGEVLVDDVVATHVRTEPAGRRMLKGFDDPIRVHTLVAEEMTT